MTKIFNNLLIEDADKNSW